MKATGSFALASVSMILAAGFNSAALAIVAAVLLMAGCVAVAGGQ